MNCLVFILTVSIENVMIVKITTFILTVVTFQVETIVQESSTATRRRHSPSPPNDVGQLQVICIGHDCAGCSLLDLNGGNLHGRSHRVVGMRYRVKPDIVSVVKRVGEEGRGQVGRAGGW